jgi:hypothetical protein
LQEQKAQIENSQPRCCDAQAQRLRPDLREIYLQPAFLICAVVLALAGGGMTMAIRSFGVYLKKEPLPLRKSLELLEECRPGGDGIGPYIVVRKLRIENDDVLKVFGTEDYINWVLEDTEQPRHSAVCRCTLFISYYKLPDQVPHVPEECYTGSGYQRLASDGVTISLSADRQASAERDAGGDKQQIRQIPARYLTFESTSSRPGAGNWVSGTRFAILYLFNANGVYANNREDVRIILGKNIFGKHSYFSKVEWQFFGNRFGMKIYPDKEETLAASRKLLSIILPVLEEQYWPVLEKGKGVLIK